MLQLAQLTIPGPKGGVTNPPPGIPATLREGLNTSGINFIQTMTNYLFLIGIILAVIFMMLAGISWITSGGDSQKLALAKKRLVYSIIGLVLVVGAFFLVSTIITVLGGKPSVFFNLR